MLKVQIHRRKSLVRKGSSPLRARNSLPRSFSARRKSSISTIVRSTLKSTRRNSISLISAKHQIRTQPHKSSLHGKLYPKAIPLSLSSRARNIPSSFSRSRSSSRSPSPGFSRSRSVSPVLPKTHHYKSSRRHGALNTGIVPPEYRVNVEISHLAAQFLNTRRSLPPIQIPNPIPNKTQWCNLPLYVISIREDRKQKFLNRFQGKNAQIFAGTHGKTMNMGSLRRAGRLVNNQLKTGEIGCYDSHIRLLEKIVRDKIPLTIICEDDVNLTASPAQSSYLNMLMEETKSVPFDIMYLSWFRPMGGSTITAHTKSQTSFCQLWSFLITLEGAKKLLKDPKVFAMHYPVDVAYFNAAKRGVIKSLLACPPLCLTVGENSDTRHLR